MLGFESATEALGGLKAASVDRPAKEAAATPVPTLMNSRRVGIRVLSLQIYNL